MQRDPLVNASTYFVKRKPKNELTNTGITAVAEVYRHWETREKLSRVITLDNARAVDYNHSPSQFVEVNDRTTHRPMTAILADLAMVCAEREHADAQLSNVLSRLGLARDTSCYLMFDSFRGSGGEQAVQVKRRASRLEIEEDADGMG